MSPFRFTKTTLLAAILAAGALYALPNDTASAGNSASSEARLSMPLQMSVNAAPMREAAEAFIVRAMAGDESSATSMLSRALIERVGEGAIRRSLEAQILPFFALGREVGRSVTVANTSDAAGNRGFVFYMWLIPADGSAPRPFSLYMVQEGAQVVVANVVPDRLVEGRHR